MKAMSCQRGSIMMEYIVLNFLFAVAIALSGYFFVAPDGRAEGGATYSIDPKTGTIVREVQNTRKFGILGSVFLERYAMMRDIVSMPYP